jgi:ATP-dependent DNA helicase RecQ
VAFVVAMAAIKFFIFTDTTFILQDIAENPKKWESWFEALFKTEEYKENGIKKKKKIHIPEIENIKDRKREFEKLKDSISRFLESYRNNVGLNFVSGFVRLALNEYEDSDGKERFESALLSVKETFAQEQQKDFLTRLKVLGKHLTEEQQIDLIQSISKYYHEMLEELAEYYDLAYLLNDVYAQKIKKIKKLNKKLYEQLAEI